MIGIALFFALGIFYPYFNAWATMKLNLGDERLRPAAPVGRYLTDDDLHLFGSIHDTRFISDAWKGLVIGAATGNFPLDSKSSTITNSILKFDTFINATCQQKNAYADQYGISYVYADSIECSKFLPLGTSSENYTLYKYQK